MKKLKKGLSWVAVLALGWFIIYLILVVVFRPSHDRDWELGHEELPRIMYTATSSNITIENYRDFAWTGTKTADVRYATRQFNLNDMTGVDVFIAHFADFEGMAHIFLSFGFANGEHIVVSVETRRESDETFSPLLGLLRQFEIIYVVGSEKDIVGVRTGYRNERVYLYPIKASVEQVRVLFDLLAKDINDIYAQPRMYNTLTHNCTNELTRPVEKMSDIRFPLTWKTVLPGYFDEVLYKLGLIDTGLPFADIKARQFIDNTRLDTTNKTYSADLRQAFAGARE